MPVGGQSQAGTNMFSEEQHRFRQEKSSCVTLALVTPTAVSLLPLTSAMLPLTTYLQEGEAGGLLVLDQDSAATISNKLQPVFKVLEVQPFSLSGHNGGDGGTSQSLEAVIVISKAVPKPNAVSVAFPSIA